MTGDWDDTSDTSMPCTVTLRLRYPDNTTATFGCGVYDYFQPRSVVRRFWSSYSAEKRSFERIRREWWDYLGRILSSEEMIPLLAQPVLLAVRRFILRICHERARPRVTRYRNNRNP